MITAQSLCFLILILISFIQMCYSTIQEWYQSVHMFSKRSVYVFIHKNTDSISINVHIWAKNVWHIQSPGTLVFAHVNVKDESVRITRLSYQLNFMNRIIPWLGKLRKCQRRANDRCAVEVPETPSEGPNAADKHVTSHNVWDRDHKRDNGRDYISKAIMF